MPTSSSNLSPRPSLFTPRAIGAFVIVLALVISTGLFLRSREFSGLPLGQDEAENAASALQMLEDGYPHGEFKGLPLYENQSFIPSASSKYEFESTNYYGSPFEKNKGWLPYVLTALSFKAFGVSPENARFPFLLLYPLTALLLVTLGITVFRSPAVGLTAAILFSLDPIAVHYGGLARYYALLAFLWTLTAQLAVLLLRANSWPAILATALSVVLLFHTHLPVAIAASAALLILAARAWGIAWFGTTKCIIPVLLVLTFTIPWILLVHFWTVATTHPLVDVTKFLWPGLTLALATAFLVAYRSFPMFRARVQGELAGPLLPISTLVLSYLTLVPFLTPFESFGIRQFVGILPLLALLGSVFLVRGVDAVRKRRFDMLPLSMVLLIPTVPLLLFALYLYRLPLAHDVEDARWIVPVIAYLETKGVPYDTWITSSAHDHAFRVAGPYVVEKVWPIRKSWFDHYLHRFLVILNTNVYRAWCLPNYRDPHRCDDPKSYPFWERVSSCPGEIIVPGVYVFDCPATVEQRTSSL